MGDNTTSRRRWVMTVLVCVGMAALVMPRLAETQSAADVGISQPPVVTVVFATSSSMQYAEGGLGDYPTLRDEDAGDINRDRHIEEWSSGEELNLPGSRRYDGNSLQPVDSEDYIQTVGPCGVWHQMEWGTNEPKCDDYFRAPPESCAIDEPWEGQGPPGIPPGQVPQDCEYFETPHPSESQGLWEDGGMLGMMTMIRDNPSMRLDDENMPRHIQIKQILTGAMELGGEPGPGCWFIPRFRDALNEEQICCEELDEHGQCAGAGSDYFESYIDHRESIPHFQEIYDVQRDDGLLDLLGSTAIFSAVAVDGYPFDGTTNSTWDYPINDIMVQGLLAEDSVGDYGDLDTECLTNASMDCHETGLFRFIGPRDYKIEPGDLMEVSNYVQEAILDAGFLVRDPDPQTYLGMDDVLGEDDQLEDDVSLYDYPRHRQPMGGGSPFGAVFHDLHRFYLQGQYHGLDENVSSNPNELQEDSFDDDPTPPEGDPYASCRGRHAVMFTDGVPQPEAEGGAGDELGYSHLEFGAGGFDEDRFPYIPAEDAIHNMLQSVEDDVMGGSVEPEFEPRVHVVGANIEDQIQLTRPDGDQGELRERALEKVGAMAHAGRTCAQYYLPPDMVAEGYDTGPAHQQDGQCDLNPDDPDDADPCLVPQSRQGPWWFHPPEEGAAPFSCDAPALVLTDNSQEAVRDAFWMIFTEIAGMSGLSAETAPSMTSYLDNPDWEPGQYRIFSGFEVTSGNNHYKGLLNRQLLTCEDGDIVTGDVEECGDDHLSCLHRDMLRLRHNPGSVDDEDLGEGGEVDGDRRRVFTSVPHFLSRFVGEDDDTEFLGQGGGAAGSYLHTTYSLQESGSLNDTFGPFNIHTIGDDGLSNTETRVSFDPETIRQTFQDLDFNDDDLYRYWNVGGTGDDDELYEDLFAEYRGLIEDRQDRVLAPIYRSNPVTVGPPDLDLPIDSYRQFRRGHSERPTMTYASTVDGQLRAIHTGEPTVQVQDNVNNLGEPMHDSGSSAQDAEDQREAWAYIPQLVHRHMFGARGGSSLDGLMDGSPVVTDIRLCQGGAPWSSNSRACPDGGQTPGSAQWRTVLVQGMGLAGTGYFALDITRSGAMDGDSEMPDPIPLWEFGPEWEMLQTMEGPNAKARYGPAESELEDYDDDDDLYDACEDAMDDQDDHFEEHFDDEEPDDVWQLSFLGSTVGEPVVGTVNMAVDDETRTQRPVAVFGGGTSANTNAPLPFSNGNLSECTDYITGRAIYVVDLQSGEMIRRFVDYNDSDGGRDRFRGEVTGTPVLSGNNPGDLSTRGFIGDEDGKMFRLDFTDANPGNWDVSLFFDPEDEILDNPGPAAFRPAVTTNANRELILLYGLAQRGDTGGNSDEQAMIAIREVYDANDGVYRDEYLWHEQFEDLEHLTGAPLMFGGDVYFTTYVENADDRCAGGRARIYRMVHDGLDPLDPDPDDRDGYGRWNEDQLDELGDIDTTGLPKWFGPTEPTLIRGMAVTMGPACELSAGDSMGQSREPQLVAQTGDTDVGTEGGGAGATGGGTGGGQVGGMGQIGVSLDPPETQSIPLSWSAIEN